MPSSVAFEPESGSATASLASNRRAIEMIEQIFSVGIESSGISLIGASPSEQTVCDTSKTIYSMRSARLEQDHRGEAGTAERWFYLGRPVKAVDMIFAQTQ